MSSFCINCGKPVPDEAAFCPACGTKVEIPRCPSCGREIEYDALFCMFCGQAIGASSPDSQEDTKKSQAQADAIPFEKIVGLWELTAIQDMDYPQSGNKNVAPQDQTSVLFRVDHTYSARDGSGKESQSGQWRLSGGKIVLDGGMELCLLNGHLRLESPKNRSIYLYRKSANPTVKQPPSAARQMEAPASTVLRSQKPRRITPKDLKPVLQNNAAYYIREFQKIEQGEKNRFNWAAFLFSFLFCYYRKCGDLAIKYFVVPYALLILSIPVGIVGATGMLSLTILALILAVPASVAVFVNTIRFGKNFNAEYYAHLKTAVKTSDGGYQGTSIGAVVAAIVIYCLATGIAAAIGWGVAMMRIDAAYDAASGPEDLGMAEDEPSRADENAVIGNWTLLSIGDEEMSFTLDSLVNVGGLDETTAADLLSVVNIHFYKDQTFESEADWQYWNDVLGENVFEDATYERNAGTWKLEGNQVYMTVSSTGKEIVADLSGDTLRCPTGSMEMVFEKQSGMETASQKPVSEEEDPYWINRYLGSWTNGGGITIKLSGTADELTYAVESLSRTARIASAYGTAAVVDRTLTFETENDVWGNAAVGTIYFLDDGTLAAECDVTYMSSSALWDLSFNYCHFYRGEMPEDYLIHYDYESEYLLPTDTQYISESDLYGMSQEEVLYARNEIYARYGCTFSTPEIRTYFEGKSWYVPIEGLNASTFDVSVFNVYETQNLETILAYEREMGWMP